MAIPELIFLPRVLPSLGAEIQLCSAIIVLLPYVFLFLASFVDPGYVLKTTLNFHGSLYPYDHALYLPGQICKTCNVPKPARSKHCSICGFCVAKADHHCIFINGCVGYGNQHWFLLLLLSTAILTSAGALLGGMHLFRIVTRTFPAFTFRGSELSWSEYSMFWNWAMMQEPGVGGISLLCLLTTPLVWGLLLYSVYLVYRGMTTNESGKWKDFQLDIDDGYIYRRPLLPNRPRDSRVEPQVIGWPKSGKEIYARTYEEPPMNTMNLPGDGPWHREWALNDVENIYDIGFLGNLIDVFLPRRFLIARTRRNGTHVE